jgi:hypothetical protein
MHERKAFRTVTDVFEKTIDKQRLDVDQEVHPVVHDGSSQEYIDEEQRWGSERGAGCRIDMSEISVECGASLDGRIAAESGREVRSDSRAIGKGNIHLDQADLFHAKTDCVLASKYFGKFRSRSDQELIKPKIQLWKFYRKNHL